MPNPKPKPNLDPWPNPECTMNINAQTDRWCVDQRKCLHFKKRSSVHPDTHTHTHIHRINYETVLEFVQIIKVFQKSEHQFDSCKLKRRCWGWIKLCVCVSVCVCVRVCVSVCVSTKTYVKILKHYGLPLYEEGDLLIMRAWIIFRLRSFILELFILVQSFILHDLIVSFFMFVINLLPVQIEYS